MKIAYVTIKNFRNLTNVSVPLFNVTTVIGNNNSGKSNFLRAITLPLLSEDVSSGSKNLSWTDIGNEAKKKYYDFIKENRSQFLSGEVSQEDFERVIPSVSVKIDWDVSEEEHYAMLDFLTGGPETEEPEYALEYGFRCKNIKELFKQVVEVLNKADDDTDIDELYQNLLPIDLYSYSIFIPQKNQRVSFDSLKNFKYNSIAAERDDFSNSNVRLGSKSLIQILNNKLETEDMIQIEKEYASFFEQIKSLSKMENILNWQELSEIENAKEFFAKISILPNMPPMTSLLNGVKLGYDDVGLASHGLGYRNLILQLVLINSMLEASKSLLSLLTIEEPEAHLCYRNEQLMMSYISSLEKGDKNLQLVYSTHSINFINKLDLKNIVLFDKGTAYAFSENFDESELDYLTKNPNLDLFKLFYSKKCILVEGISEELLIKSYLRNQNKLLNDVEVISFHKGFKKIISLWIKLNEGSTNKLGIIRDFDNEPAAQKEHERYNQYDNICIRTTQNYTLEDEIVSQNNNFFVLKDYFENKYDWSDIGSKEELSKKWKNAKAEVMLKFCQDLSSEALKNIVLPRHIDEVLRAFDLARPSVEG